MAVDLLAVLLRQGSEQLVAFPLVIPFRMIMSRVFGKAALQRTFAQQNQLWKDTPVSPIEPSALQTRSDLDSWREA
jgi:hypothetical protein